MKKYTFKLLVLDHNQISDFVDYINYHNIEIDNNRDNNGLTYISMIISDEDAIYMKLRFGLNYIPQNSSMVHGLAC